MKEIILNYLKIWGVKAVMKVIIGSLREQGTAERKLAEDFENAIARYERS